MSELIVSDGQVQYNGYLLGDNENTFMVSISGWDDIPGVDSANSLRPSAHGGWSGHKYSGQRIITWEGRFAPLPEAWVTESQALREALTLPGGTAELPIYVRMRDEILIAYGALIARAMPGDYNYSNYGARLTLQFECSDPRRYYLNEQESPIGLVVPADQGLQYPLVYPLDYGDPLTPSTAVLVNEGNIETPVVISIEGPIESPSIVNQSTGRRLDFDISLTENDTLVVDTQKGSVVLNGTADRIYTRSLSSSPILSFNLVPGDNSMRILADDWETGAVVRFNWRSAVI